MTDRIPPSDAQPLLDELRQLHYADRPSEAVRERACQGVRERLSTASESPYDGPPRPSGAREVIESLLGELRFRAAAWMPWAIAASALAGVGLTVAFAERSELSAVSLEAEPDLPRAPSEASRMGSAAGRGLLVAPCPALGEPGGQRDGPVRRELATPRGFEQEAPAGCGVTRRYLEYIPEGVALPAARPVVMLLHDAADSAEDLRDVQTLRRFDELARRDGFIAVYASALPGAGERRWQLSSSPEHGIDDEGYLERVLDHLRERGVIAAGAPTFLIGHGQGADLALRAAAHRPDLYSGVAALMPAEGSDVVPSLGSGARLSRALFMSRSKESRAMVHDWALALGISHAIIEGARPIPLPDLAVEGRAHTDLDTARQRPLDSRVERFDLAALEPLGPAVRALFVSPSASRSLPMPSSEGEEALGSAAGFRNRDIDSAEAAWSFLRGALER